MFLLIVGTIIVAYVSFVLIRQLLSPLRGVPEPNGGLPILGHTLKITSSTDQVALQNKWAEQFMDLGLYKTRSLFYGAELLHVVRAKWCRYVLGSPEIFPRTDFLNNYFPCMADGVFLVQDEQHSFQKSLLHGAFSESHLENYVTIFEKHTQKLLAKFTSMVKKSPRGASIDLLDHARALTYNIIGEVAFGVQFEEELGYANKFTDATTKHYDAIQNSALSMLIGFFPFVRNFPGVRENIKGDGEREFLKKIVADRKRKIQNGSLTESEKKDFLTFAIQGKDAKTGKTMTDKEIEDNCFSFLIGGWQTTATTILICIHQMAQHPEMQARARKEVEKLPKGDIKVSNLDLPYLTAFIKESLRFYPTVSANARISTKDFKLGELEFPKGTKMFLYTANRDPEEFEHPDEFIPERFMPGSQMKAGSFFSFGWSSTICLGKSFALLQTRLAVARLLQRFSFSIEKKDLDMTLAKKRKPFLAIRTDHPSLICFKKL